MKNLTERQLGVIFIVVPILIIAVIPRPWSIIPALLFGYYLWRIGRDVPF